MRFLLDVNLAPRWCEEFERRGHSAVHWKDVGPLAAPDAVVMDWARANDHVLFTHDLDFGALPALAPAAGPSEVRVRQPVPEVIGETVFAAIERHRRALVRGALLTIDPGRDRVRLLPHR